MKKLTDKIFLSYYGGPIVMCILALLNLYIAYTKDWDAPFQWSGIGVSIGLAAGLLMSIPVRKRAKELLKWGDEANLVLKDALEDLLEQHEFANKVKGELGTFKNATDFEKNI